MRRPSRQGMLSLCLRLSQGIDNIANSITGYFYKPAKVPVSILLVLPVTSVAQNINFEWVNIRFHRNSLKSARADESTSSTGIVGLADQLREEILETFNHKSTCQVCRRCKKCLCKH